VDAASGAVACGIKGHRLDVLDQDWEAAFFVEKCPGCFAAVVAHGEACQEPSGRGFSPA